MCSLLLSILWYENQHCQGRCFKLFQITKEAFGSVSARGRYKWPLHPAAPGQGFSTGAQGSEISVPKTNGWWTWLLLYCLQVQTVGEISTYPRGSGHRGHGQGQLHWLLQKRRCLEQHPHVGLTSTVSHRCGHTWHTPDSQAHAYSQVPAWLLSPPDTSAQILGPLIHPIGPLFSRWSSLVLTSKHLHSSHRYPTLASPPRYQYGHPAHLLHLTEPWAFCSPTGPGQSLPANTLVHPMHIQFGEDTDTWPSTWHQAHKLWPMVLLQLLMVLVNK